MPQHTIYTLGLDLSTQSLTATILKRKAGKTESCGSWSVGFRNLAEPYQLDKQTLCLAKERLTGAKDPAGFFAQEPQLFLESLDLLLAKMQSAKAPLAEVSAINCSAQQHGQLWLNKEFGSCCEKLKQCEEMLETGQGLAELFSSSYAYPAAPIWMCSQTAAEAEHLLSELGPERVLELSGSAAPLRFSGLVLRWLAQHDAAAYERCRHVHLLSSWLAAVLSGNSTAPIDWGSGAGTSLMDYRNKIWSDDLLACLAPDTAAKTKSQERAAQLRAKLPELTSPLSTVGHVAAYFGKYGLNSCCKVLAGSGDNPQTKVCQQGDLLSLGSSFVLMSQAKQLHAWANAMYDGLGQPFSFACRTNGALVWDAYRESLGLSFAQQDQALAANPFGSVHAVPLRLMNESFPPNSPNVDNLANFQAPYAMGLASDAGRNLAAVIDGTLQELHTACQEVFGPSHGNEVLYVTGGPTQSLQILRRIEAIWQRPVEVFHSAGASYGAALAAQAVL